DLSDDSSRPFVATPFSETDAAFSPRGRWIAYVSDESGQPEVYVAPFPSGPERWQVSKGGGSQPRWRADEKEIFYCSPDGAIMSVKIEPQAAFKAGMPQRLFACDLRPSRDNLRE